MLGGGRLMDNGSTDDRRIEITFKLCYYLRTAPHLDSEGVEALGYEVASGFEGASRDYLDWLRNEWHKNGICSYSGFYVARESAWRKTLPEFFQKDYWHYVVNGRDGCVELIARSFKWREWLWVRGDREDAVKAGPIVGEGEGID